MPEGHTIHRLARQHTALLRNRRLAVHSPQGRFAEGAARLDGRPLRRVEPYGKHLFYDFGAGDWLHIHLGLYGTFVRGPLPAPEPRGALRLRMCTDEAYVDLRGPTACELIPPGERRAILARLGPDPLRRGADPAPAYARVARSRVAFGALLMDQSVLAGVGNVYRAEVLFRAGMSPHRLGLAVSAAEWEGVWTDLVGLMRAGVRDGIIVTTRREHRGRTARPPVERRFYVYRRAGLPCRVCGTEVRTEVLAGRNLFWCPHCQPR